MGPSNRVVVFHGIRKFVVPFCQTHKNGEDSIAFVNDNMDDNEFPDIIKLNEYDFEEAWDWPHPTITDIMNIKDGSQVLSVQGEKDKQRRVSTKRRRRARLANWQWRLMKSSWIRY